jgi:hypothetical protein
MKPPAAKTRRLRPASGLRVLQRAMAAAVMRPLTDANRSQPRWTDGRPMGEVASEFIKPNDRMDAVERLEIYNRMYWFRVLDSLEEDCPGLRAVLGVRRFRRLVEAYLARYPSRSYTLRDLSRHLAQFIREEPPLTSPHSSLAVDLARLEWAQIEAFDGPAEPPLTPEEISAANPARLRLGLQPHLTLLALNHAVDDFVLAVKGVALRSEASNAPGGLSAGTPLSRVARPGRKRVYVAVHRHKDEVYFKRLEPAAHRLLAALRDGATLAHACAVALPKRAASSPAWQRKVRDWFSNWAELGWFCRRAGLRGPN